MQKIELPYHFQTETTSIYIGTSIDLTQKMLKPKRVAAVIDEGAFQKNSKKITQFLSSIQATVIRIPGGERCKNRETKAFIEDQLLEEGHGVDTVILAIGGGATLDITGFVAATFCRGVELIYIPTTLLAMVDASIGGKNGLNVQSAKNQIGTLYFPSNVVIDVTFVQTLPKEEIRNGIVEMMKHALLQGEEQVNRLLINIQSLVNCDESTLLREVSENVQFKCSIVQSAKKYPKVRDLLNFGHTVGHAIELASSCSHGQAVAKGMQVEAKLSERKGILQKGELIKIQEAIDAIGLEFPLVQYQPKELWSRAFQFDKKSVNGKPRAVYLEKIGKPHIVDFEYTHPITDDDIHALMKEFS